MWSLFDTKQDSAGFRLNYMQVYNWGTFDERIYTLNAETQSSLLTGANGSGKTTIVDALLTLLVPSTQRFYNQSSGAEKKKERTEESYVEGHYGRTQDEDSYSSKISKLRPDRSNLYSIILANFVSSDTANITAFQVRYFKNNSLQREYVVANRALKIESDIQFDSKGEWRKKLKAGGKVSFFDSFSQYSQKLIEDFGMKSDKALNLFNQTVGIKVLGNLDEFIRTNMLEESDIENEFKSLLENYQNLLTAHRSIEKSKCQLELLEPIYNNYFQYETLYQEIKNAENKIDTIRTWFKIKQREFNEQQIRSIESDIELLNGKKAKEEGEKGKIEAEILSLKLAREKDPTAAQLKDIDAAMKMLEQDMDQRKKRVGEYNKLAMLCGLPKDPSEKAFIANHKSIEKARNKSFDTKKELDTQLLDAKQEQRQKQDRFDEIKGDIEYLQKRKDKITGISSQIRQRIVDYVKASEDELPFVGELIEVKKEEQNWEMAIEKLLHSFGKCLVVPEKYYREVNKFVSNNDLGGKLVYYRVDPKQDYLKSMTQAEENSVVTKLNFNPKSDYSDWVEDFITRSFDYVCCDKLEEFARFEKAMMPSGLIKNKKRHEKDDSKFKSGAANYVLGWNNRDKVVALQREGNLLNTDLQQLEARVSDLNSKTDLENDVLDSLRRLSEFNDFSQIDWKECSQRIAEKETEKKELLKKNSTLDDIEKKLKQKEELKKQIESTLEDLIGDLRLQGKERDDLAEKVRQLSNTIQELSKLVDLNREFAKYPELIAELQQSKDDVYALEKNTLQRLKEELERIEQTHGKAFVIINEAMDNYLRPSREIQEKFPEWMDETHNLKAKPEYLKEFVDLYKSIKDEKVAEFEKRFKNELNNSVIKDLSSFQNKLYEQESTIKDSIDNINRSLKRIRFNVNPDTYIQLQFNATRTPEVLDFRKRLKEWVPNTQKLALNDMSYLEEHFSKVIRPFVEELQKNDTWRKRVTDVRNWMEFKATEHYAEDNQISNVYESSGSLSGGQAAQLTYTILGSAIAHQFGINQSGSTARSFRFIAVDEAFSKLDPEKSKYLMELCKQLHLQLMVVTPLDKIHVVEDYVSVIHYVENKNKRNSEVVDMSIMEYKQKKKK
ncbi:MAG: SbcC/MukB-like Walker B domain-containing protein [Chitinophagales bacterium]